MMYLLTATVGEENSLYQFHQGALFLPGAGSTIFQPLFQLPLIQVRGRGVMAGRAPNPLQPPQVYFNPTTTTAGIGGEIAGQIMFQGLIVPEDEG